MSLNIPPTTFSGATLRAAWKRQGGQCARCGTRLIVANQDKGDVGAWHPHPRFRELGYHLEDNCALLCINPPNNCHWNFGHAGHSERHYQPLEDSDLPYLYAGTKRKYPSPEFKKILKDFRRSYHFEQYLP